MPEEVKRASYPFDRVLFCVLTRQARAKGGCRPARRREEWGRTVWFRRRKPKCSNRNLSWKCFSSSRSRPSIRRSPLLPNPFERASHSELLVSAQQVWSPVSVQCTGRVHGLYHTAAVGQVHVLHSIQATKKMLRIMYNYIESNCYHS